MYLTEIPSLRGCFPFPSFLAELPFGCGQLLSIAGADSSVPVRSGSVGGGIVKESSEAWTDFLDDIP